MRAKDWLAQAENDFLWAHATLTAGHFAQTCFIAQQVAEKALKALGYHRGADLARGHSVLQLCRELGLNGPLERAAARLDQYYLTTRYPDAVPAGAPFEYFSEEQAKEALTLAEAFLRETRNGMGAGGNG